MLIPVGAWTPDDPDFQDPGSTEALNVIPRIRSYSPFPALASVSNALAARCQGAIFARKADGTGVVFAGDATKLYRLSSASFADVSRLAGGAYATTTDGFWSFTQFGPNILAFNGIDAPQAFNIDSDSNFSALGGSPPVALYSCVVGDFVMTLQQPGARARAQWSAINNAASWAASQATQASYQDIPAGGWGQGIVGLNYAAAIFLEFAIYLASYEGPPTVFRFAKIADGLGCTIPGSIANYRDLIFFCDRSGFYMLQGGAAVTPIGAQRVDNWFWSNLDQGHLGRCCAGVDPVNGLYAIAFPDLTSVTGELNHLLLYSWTQDRWAHVQPGNLELLFSAATQSGYTLEGLDAVSTSLDGLPFSLDSYVWTGIARRLLGGFDPAHRLGYFNGANLGATVTTTEAAPGNGKLMRVRSARPLVDGGTPSLALGLRNRQADSVAYGSPVALNALGTCPLNQAGRYLRGRITLPAGASWSHIQGIDDLDLQPEGRF
jgi:hypothetical protein